MNTNRFETFYDAVLAIVITILVLKIPQPASPTWGAFFGNSLAFTTYAIVFLAIINIWYNNHNLFQYLDEIDNRALFAYGFNLFLISLFPYFALWISMNPYSLTAETIFGLIIFFANISHIIALLAVYGANRYNEKLNELNIKPIHLLVPILIIIIGFIISYTLYAPGIYVASLISVFVSIVHNRLQRREFEDTDRFEALIDAIVAIIITIIVLEIPLAVNGSLGALLDLKLEFLAYIISFTVVFNIWKLTYNAFSIIKKISYKVIWSTASMLFFLSLIPYLTTFVSMNFYDFVPQCIYGINFMILAICSAINAYELKRIDKSNIYLQKTFDSYNNLIITLVLTCIFIAIGYYFYPPIIILSCLLSVCLRVVSVSKRINLLEII